MNLKELRTIAEKATSGPWIRDESIPQTVRSVNCLHKPVGAGKSRITTCGYPDDSTFIAAFNPATALELLDRIEKLRDALKFYASPTRWEWTTHESTYDGIGCTDFESFKSLAQGPSQVGGKTARAALAEDDK